MKVLVKVLEGNTIVFNTTINKTLEIGRQQRNEPSPVSLIDTPDGPRLVVEEMTARKTSRKQIVMEVLSGEFIRIENHGSNSLAKINAPDANRTYEVQSLDVKSKGSSNSEVALLPAEHVDVALPISIAVGQKTILVEPCEVEKHNQLEGLATMTMAPGRASSPAKPFVELFTPENRSAIGESVLDWLQKTMDVFQRSAGSSDFMPYAAQAVVDTVGLDVAAILLLENGKWVPQTVATKNNIVRTSWEPSTTILNQVCKEKRTLWKLPAEQGIAASLVSVQALVAAPILDSEGEVIGAIYGDRRQDLVVGIEVSISLLEAKLVELMACGVAAGLARLDQEKVAIAARVQFEQFFSPELASELNNDEDMLAGKDAAVTLLIGDISGFSRITERLRPERTVAWINDVMETFSTCVIDEGGVLVDYVGDELFAMWGAPVAHEDHVQRCCRAGMAMRHHLPALNAKWQQEVGEEFGFGIGINTGIARVGNVGSKRKFKYGPLGNSVNLTSRVQGATKFLQTSLLITGSTAEKLGDEFSTRRLCQVRVVNIQEPVELFELVKDPGPEWLAMRDDYEAALSAFEQHDLRQTAKILGSLITNYPGDGASVLLLSRTANLLYSKQRESFDPVWELPGK